MTLADPALLRLFSDIHVINLVHRADRRREMADEFRAIAVPPGDPAIRFFPAKAPADKGPFITLGARGCFESHMGVLQAIIDSGAERALLLEDDVHFVPDFNERLAAMLPVLTGQDWDMFYSVRPVNKAPGDSDLGAGLIALAPDSHFPLAHFVGFSARAARTALDYLRVLYDRQPGDPRGGPMHVDGAYGWMRRDHPDLRVLSTLAPLAVQRPSRSDIARLPWYDQLPALRQLVGVARRLKR